MTLCFLTLVPCQGRYPRVMEPDKTYDRKTGLDTGEWLAVK